MPAEANSPRSSWRAETGRLPSAAEVQAAVDDAHARFRAVDEGANSSIYPALERAPRDRFGICVVGTNGRVIGAGDVEDGFAIMSVSKPFVFALVCDALGVDDALTLLGANPTGLPFNATEAVTRSPDGRTNPMVNPGAIAATSHVPGDDARARWAAIVEGLSRFAGRALEVDEDVYASAMTTNHRNRELARLVDERGLLGCDVDEAVERYTRQCSLRVRAVDLATMGATLADGGVEPRTGVRVVSEAACHATLAVMAAAGLYEASGDWLTAVGLPGKSGIGGGIVTVSPGKGGLGTYAPPLDGAGNSVRGQLAAAYLSRRLGLSLFASAPARQR